MKTNKTGKHIHKYMKVDLKFASVYRCALPTCNHYQPPHLHDLLIGKASICWGCGNQFTMDEDSLTEDFPKCMDCKGVVVPNYSSDARTV